MLHWLSCGVNKILYPHFFFLLIDWFDFSVYSRWMNRAQRRGMDLSEGHKTAGRSPLTCVNGAKTYGERRLFKGESGQPWMFVHSFSAVITRTAISWSHCALWEYPDSTWSFSLEICLHCFYTKGTATQHWHLHKSSRNMIFFFIRLSFVS